MPITVFRRVREKAFPSRGSITKVPYEIYTLEEAKERGIEPVEHWREVFFRGKEDLTDKYVLTDDDPPLVTPVVKCTFLPNWPANTLEFPWTRFRSSRAKLLYGKKSTVDSPYCLKQKIKYVKLHTMRLFIILFVLGADGKKLVECLWGTKEEVEQEFLLKSIMKSEKFERAAQSLAGEAFEKVGLVPEEIAERIKNLLEDEKTPVKLRIDGYFNVADRVGMKEKEDKPDALYLGGAVEATMLSSGAEHPNVQQLMAEQVGDLVEEASPKVRKRLAKVKLQGEEVPDE